jgi:hypothetical protein
MFLNPYEGLDAIVGDALSLLMGGLEGNAVAPFAGWRVGKVLTGIRVGDEELLIGEIDGFEVVLGYSEAADVGIFDFNSVGGEVILG